MQFSRFCIAGHTHILRKVRIIQEGTDFKRDPTRRVMIHGLEDHDEACDYFDFIGI